LHTTAGRLEEVVGGGRMTKKSEDKRLKAVALHYADGERAPHIVATGVGEIARRILELAHEHQIPVKEDSQLVEILSKLDLGYEIPPETYRAVAEILAFLYRTDEAWRKRKLAQDGIDLLAKAQRRVQIQAANSDEF
jgi:flagellar biosynthesis protein